MHRQLIKPGMRCHCIVHCKAFVALKRLQDEILAILSVKTVVVQMRSWFWCGLFSFWLVTVSGVCSVMEITWGMGRAGKCLSTMVARS